jgi:hypothetical protein
VFSLLSMAMGDSLVGVSWYGWNEAPFGVNAPAGGGMSQADPTIPNPFLASAVRTADAPRR